MLLFLFNIACGSKSDDTAIVNSSPSTFTQVENDILGVSCAFGACHASSAGGLLLDGETDYERLVNVESIFVSASLVVPNDPDASYLVNKVEGSSNIVGDQMPSADGLSPEQLQTLRSWIENGALND